ncbi:NUDIX domain-containing protein [Streptomyces chryseus]
MTVFRNRFGTLFNDDVIAPSGAAGSYLRWKSDQEGVVVVPVGPAGYALVTSYRYPIHAASLEFPRGGAERGESLAAAAARELREETGLVGRAMRPLGLVHADTGILASPIHVFLTQVDPEGAQPARPEGMESLTAPLWVSPDELPQLLSEGRLTCGITLAALALLQGHHTTLSAEKGGSMPA